MMRVGIIAKDNHKIYLLYYLFFSPPRYKLAHSLYQFGRSHNSYKSLWLINENGIYDYDFEF